jgi:hypothetical protein
MAPLSYRRHRFPAEMIQQAIYFALVPEGESLQR